jgi:hypothetical protein
MKRPATQSRHSTDFDVISGPSQASACPIVETMPEAAEAADPEPSHGRDTSPAETADAA